MLVMHLQTRGYALALYASEKEALEACKTNIVPEQPGHKYSPLLLRILRRERPAPSEAVYTPTLTVEGEVVQKAELADSRGLELVYRGRAVAKWCPHTLAGRIAPLERHATVYTNAHTRRPSSSGHVWGGCGASHDTGGESVGAPHLMQHTSRGRVCHPGGDAYRLLSACFPDA
ncbi:hypothetical protein C4B63_12g327 [Trypanosoma cruzi]|uniref:Uncharacterized protein n=1 Tax=Trypanosoma cruzi TaxID=5693 RepID=A0A2V2VQG0_TRYCR|nr:hypothetical protein C4B63_12g327 [Trypanosoma cruzi]